ncbi:hypothetical protein AB3S75_042015 [Citrus x aurantiifolia]
MKVVPLAKKPKKDFQSVAAESSSGTLEKIDATEKFPKPAMLKRNRGDADHNKSPVTISLESFDLFMPSVVLLTIN